MCLACLLGIKGKQNAWKISSCIHENAFTGKSCETAAMCNSSPCQNDGSCDDVTEGFFPFNKQKSVTIFLD